MLFLRVEDWLSLSKEIATEYERKFPAHKDQLRSVANEVLVELCSKKRFVHDPKTYIAISIRRRLNQFLRTDYVIRINHVEQLRKGISPVKTFQLKEEPPKNNTQQSMEIMEILDQCCINEDDRRIIQHKLEGCTITEISEAISLPRSSVYIRLQQLFKTFREKWND